jgi:hypothetical protein
MLTDTRRPGEPESPVLRSPDGARGALAAARTVRRHWLFASLFCLGLAFRVLCQVAYRPALVYIDSVRYLGGSYGPDPLDYRALLWPLQRIGGLAAVAAAQHLLGLGLALALYLVLRRRGVWPWAAAVAAAPVLLDAYQLQAEQTIMPDVLFETLVVAGLAAVMWRPDPAGWQFAMAGVILGQAADVRQVGEVLIVPLVAFAVVSTAGCRRQLAAGVLAATCFAVPVLAYMSAQYSADGQFSISEKGQAIFYGRMAAAADCATLRLPASERALCPSPATVAALGIDNLNGAPASPLYAYQPPAGLTRAAAARQFELAVLRQQPLAVARAVGRDFIKLFALTRDQIAGDTPISRWQFQASYPTYPPFITRQYIAQIRPGGSNPAVSRSLAAALRAYQLHGGYTPGPFLLLSLVAALAGTCALAVPRRRQVPAAAACLLVTASALALLLAADSVEFSWRYQLPAIPLLPAAGMLGLAAWSNRLADAAPGPP